MKYIHVESDRPPSITKQILKSITTRLFSLSSSKEIFHQATSYYTQSLASSGHKRKLIYVEKSVQNKKEPRKRKRNITWFNSPYSKTVKTKTGKHFFRLINKHFPPEHKFRKIFKKNTLNLSYSCMPNMNSQNQMILQGNPKFLPKAAVT